MSTVNKSMVTEGIGSDSSNVTDNNGLDNAKAGSNSKETNPFESWVKLDSDPIQEGNGQPGEQPVVDLNAPFDSVKEEVSKFGGIVDWKVHKEQTDERLKQVHHELDIAAKEIPKYKEQSEAAEIGKNKALQELGNTKALMEELKHNLEKAEVDELQAKQDSELAKIRMKEVKLGVANRASAAAKEELEVAKERHTAAVDELVSVKQEMAVMKKDYNSLVTEKELAIKKADHSISESKHIEKTVDNLTLELMETKELLNHVQSAHSEEEAHRINPALALEQNALICENELAKAEAELQQLTEQHLLINALTLKCATASGTLNNLRTELDSQLEQKVNPEAQLLDGIATDMQMKTAKVLATTRKELEDVRERIEKSKHEVNTLKAAAMSLKSELETEDESVRTMKLREGPASTLLSSLEQELNRMNTELELIHKREREYRVNMSELLKLIQEATDEADIAKSVSSSAEEDLKNWKQNAEKAKAGASAMDTRLQATLKGIESTNSSTLKTLKESKQKVTEPDNPSGTKISVEEYHRNNKKAQEAKELAKERVIHMTEQVNSAKQSETACRAELKQANEKLEEKKTELKLATDIEEKAQEGKLEVEQELRSCRDQKDKRRNGSDAAQGSVDYNDGGSENGSTAGDKPQVEHKHSSSSFKIKFPRIGSSSSSSSSDSKNSKRSFFPRVVMFLARKKAQTLK